jgi:hypothetical protein
VGGEADVDIGEDADRGIVPPPPPPDKESG